MKSGHSVEIGLSLLIAAGLFAITGALILIQRTAYKSVATVEAGAALVKLTILAFIPGNSR